MAFIAPAGTPISFGTFSAGLARGVMQPSIDARLAHALAQHSGHQRCWLMSTGRAAMVIALQAMRDAVGDPRRTEVIVPAYTCYSVPASVIRAGLQPRLCDIDPSTLSMEVQALEQFDFSRVLGIVTANLYGIPNQLDAIERIAKRAGVLMLDDAAQSLGASLGGRPVGGFGDVGLYSFDKGKNITSLEGGALIASDPKLSARIEALHSALPATPFTKTAMTIVKLGAYSLLLRPTLYDFVRQLPGLGLGKTKWEDDYPIQQYSRPLAGFTHSLYGQLQSLSKRRRDNANSLSAALRAVPGMQLIEPPVGSLPAYTRLPFLVTDASRRDAVIAKLNDAGIGATASYPSALCDVPEVARTLPQSDLTMPAAQRVANSIVTLPTHPYCPSDLPARVGQTLSSIK
ncbi:DegT/DnrJ/EryC1/StrS family aminotransferase [Steroidobacter sp.]|uniref:DegT/DnrJ/EryC1/StrS family aminotransferase n=1 Tax=Steroidobacter sp. TaxID=1978227 RepID=UPI001A403CBC|nr:DegT/DnrJ/EryC1/StrS family aminotransferase [Steroidobacter sp.]MBL8270478.1 DegT/DnrJ/EryC1/StrS family aminotransferase [Steroidobacter sp.]